MSGIEISAVTDGRDVHVLGYFIDTSCASLRDFLDSQRQERRRRVRKMGDRLAALGYPVDVSSILEDASAGRSVGRPQIAAAMVDAGYVATRDEAFARFLEFGGPAFVARRGYNSALYRVSPEVLVAIGNAREVRIRFKGVNNVVEREMNSSSRQHFRHFLAKYFVPEPDPGPSTQSAAAPASAPRSGAAGEVAGR